MIGAHLDWVEEGPGINDNGSGIVDDAGDRRADREARGQAAQPVRFAFWGAEEAGLVGSTAVRRRARPEDERERDRGEPELRHGRVAELRPVRLRRRPVRRGAAARRRARRLGADRGVFQRYFESQGLATEPTAFDGRSDYGPFIANGIAAGGLFTGAEGIKTEEQEAKYGGVAGLAYDPCYHQACDTFLNLSHTALDEMSDAVAHAGWTLARRRARSRRPRARRRPRPRPRASSGTRSP